MPCKDSYKELKCLVVLVLLRLTRAIDQVIDSLQGSYSMNGARAGISLPWPGNWEGADDVMLASGDCPSFYSILRTAYSLSKLVKPRELLSLRPSYFTQVSQ